MATAAEPPTLSEPGAGFAFTAQTQVPTFKVNAPTGKAGVFFEIHVSSSSAPKPPGDFYEGMIGRDGDSMNPGETSTGTYTATPSSNSAFLRTPGTWYWQAGYLDGGAWVVSEIRQLIVKPLPGPAPLSPPDGQQVPYGGEVQLAVQDQPLVSLGLPVYRYVSISRSPTRDAQGDFTDEEFKLPAYVSPDYPNRYIAFFGNPYSEFPGKYYWIGQRLDVTAGDADNNVSSTAMRSFTVEPKPTGGGGKAPDTVLTKKPPRSSPKTTVRIAFQSRPAGAKFQCQYARGWSPCRSPLTFRHVRPGKYIFRVRAMKNGKVDRTPASCRFRVTKGKGRLPTGSSPLRPIG